MPPETRRGGAPNELRSGRLSPRHTHIKLGSIKLGKGTAAHAQKYAHYPPADQGTTVNQKQEETSVPSLLHCTERRHISTEFRLWRGEVSGVWGGSVFDFLSPAVLYCCIPSKNSAPPPPTHLEERVRDARDVVLGGEAGAEEVLHEPHEGRHHLDQRRRVGLVDLQDGDQQLRGGEIGSINENKMAISNCVKI